ncbi:MAG TPA: hypothetical protein VNX61_04060 [Rhizomicrobium sp.]|nr:hypothetical protein [Rhizomicrobium sp.]
MNARILRTVVLTGLIATAVTPQALAQEAGEPSEEKCGWFVEQPDGKTILVDDPDLHVLEQTRDVFAPSSKLAGRKGIYCIRSDIVPAKNDYKLLNAGYPFNIYALVAEQKYALVLEINDGRLQARLLIGEELPPETQTRIQAYLNATQPLFSKK